MCCPASSATIVASGGPFLDANGITKASLSLFRPCIICFLFLGNASSRICQHRRGAFFSMPARTGPCGAARDIFPVSRRQPVELLVADEHCSACHNARNQSAHTRKQHRVYHKFDHCAFLYRAPLQIPQLHRLADKVSGRMGASAEVLVFFRAWHSRNIQQARTRRSNDSLVGGNEWQQSGNLDSSKRDEDLLDSMRASRCT